METKYTIQQIEILSDIKAHTLRIWEKRYGIIKPKRSEGNFRYFDDDELRKILNISYLNKNGLKISKIAELSVGDIENKVLTLYEKQEPSETSFPMLTKALIDYKIEIFQDFFKQYLEENSFEDCLNNVIYPFFEKIGILWQTNKICPAQEHLFSQHIKQLVAGKIIETSTKPTKGNVLLFLRENEFHDLGLSVYHYFLKSKGYQVFNLGASVPFVNLLAAIDKIKPDYVLTSFMAYIDDEEFINYVSKMESDIAKKETKIVLTGNHNLLEKHQNDFSYLSIKSLDSFHNTF